MQVIGLVMKLDQHYNVSKHLSQATRQILERLAWTSDSPLWEKIQANGGRFPLIQQVSADSSDLPCFNPRVCIKTSFSRAVLQNSFCLQVMSQSFLESSQSVDSDCHQPQGNLKVWPKTLCSFTEDWTISLFCSDHVSFEMYFSSNDNGEHPPAVNKLERNNSLHQFSRMVSCVMFAAFGNGRGLVQLCFCLSSGLRPGSSTSGGPVLQPKALWWSEGDDLDVFWELAGSVPSPHGEPSSGSAALLFHLHHSSGEFGSVPSCWCEQRTFYPVMGRWGLWGVSEHYQSG